MLRKESLLLILLGSCLLVTPAHAGWKNIGKGLRPRQRVTRTTDMSKRASEPSAALQKPGLFSAHKNLRVLNERAERSFFLALQAQRQTSAKPLFGGPILRRQGLTKISLLSAKRLYPDNPSLQHPFLGARLAEAYFLEHNNLLFIEHLKEVEKFWPAFADAIPRFYKEAGALAQPTNLLEWTAAQVPAQINDLFIGELHGQHEIPQFVSELLPLLRQQNPNRKIFLFTEFLLNRKVVDYNVMDLITHYPKAHYYEPVWEAAEKLHIPVIGLESSHVELIYPVTMADASEDLYHVPAGISMEGMRLRNEHWQKILQKYRAQNPDALFVVYTGSAHSLYNYPFSLAKQLPKETTRMLDLTVESFSTGGEEYYQMDSLQLLNPYVCLPQTVVKWKSPDLIQLSGFDMRIRLPNTPEPKELSERKPSPLRDLLR